MKQSSLVPPGKITPVPAADGQPGLPVTGRQLNHGSWTLPVCLSSLEAPTLWLAVSCWVMQQGVGVTRDDIAHAFRISPRRAADVLTYIMNDCGDAVKMVKKIDRVASGHRQARFRVLQVVMPALTNMTRRKPPAAPGRRNAKKGNHRESELLNQLRDVFLGRRPMKEGN